MKRQRVRKPIGPQSITKIAGRKPANEDLHRERNDVEPSKERPVEQRKGGRRTITECQTKIGKVRAAGNQNSQKTNTSVDEDYG